MWYDIYMKKTEMIETGSTGTVTISRAEYEEFQAQRKKISELEGHVEMLMEALRLARHKRFGASSEKSEDALAEQLSFLFNEAEVYSAAREEEAENVTAVAAHRRHKKHEYTLDTIPEGIPVKQAEHRLEGEELVCPQCGETMTEIGKEVIRTLEIIPAQTIVREDIYYTYACRKLQRKCRRRLRNARCKGSPGEKHDSWQLCHAGGCRPYHDAEVRNGFAAVPAGTGDEPTRDPPEPADHVQLDSESSRGLPDAHI